MRRANISKELRDQLELFGETVISHALAITYRQSEGPQGVTFVQTGPFTIFSSGLLNKLVTEHRSEALEWLTEKRDIAERKEQRLETVEIAILFFVVLGVVADFLLLFRWIRN